MIYRRFGKTELQMPLVTCGGMRFHHKWSDIEWSEVPADGQKNLEDCVAYGLENGVNHFETARGYGSSELQMGAAFAKHPREDMIIQTKDSPEGGPEKFRERFELSMKTLKLDYVDLLGIHGMNDRGAVDDGLSCIDEALKIKAEGRAKHIGFSTHGSPREIMEAIDSGAFEYINLHWYFVNDLNWKCIEAAHKADMGVFIISPNDKGGKLYEPSEKLKELCSPLDPMDFNSLFCWAREEVHTLSMGVARPEEFDTHLSAVEKVDSAKELIAPVEARLRAEVDRVCGTDWLDTWFEGVPEYYDLPHQINVREIVRLWTWAKSLDMVEFGKMRYNMMGNAGHWAPGSKAIDFDEKEMVDALGDSKIRHQVPDILREAHAMLDAEQGKRLSKSD